MQYSDVIKHFGSVGLTADAIGKGRSTVSEWRNEGVPDLRQLQLEILSEGKLRARADIPGSMAWRRKSKGPLPPL